MSLRIGATIGDSYAPSIGQTYPAPEHSHRVPKLHKTGFWDRLVRALRDKGYEDNHQTVVARLIGIRQPSVHLWAKGRTMPSMANVVELASKLGVDANYLLTGAKSKRKSQDVDPTANELLALWPRLTDVTKGRLLGIATESIQGRMRPADDGGEDQEELQRPPN